MKLCTSCGVNKEESEFNKNKTHKDGLQAHCKGCVKAQHQRWYQANKTVVMNRTSQRRVQLFDKIRDVKQQIGCCKCNEREPACLDFHHVNAEEKDFDVADMVAAGKGWSSIQKEIAKCVCVCANCHRKIHAGIITL